MVVCSRLRAAWRVVVVASLSVLPVAWLFWVLDVVLSSAVCQPALASCVVQVTSEGSGTLAISALDLERNGECVPHGVTDAFPSGAGGDHHSWRKWHWVVWLRTRACLRFAKTYSVVDEVFASLRAGCPPPPMAAAADEAVEGQDVTVAHHLA